MTKFKTMKRKLTEVNVNKTKTKQKTQTKQKPQTKTKIQIHPPNKTKQDKTEVT